MSDGVPPGRSRIWSETGIQDFLDLIEEKKVAVATLDTTADAKLFRLAVYNYLRARNITRRPFLRVSGCDVIASSERPTPRTPLSIETLR